MTNYYPKLPIVAFKRTSVSLQQLSAAISASPVTKEVKCMAYVMMRNETGNGAKVNNNNVGGIQADSGVWSNPAADKANGVFQVKENGTGKDRLFLAFPTLQDSVNFMCAKIAARQLYIGGTPPKIYKEHITTVSQLADAYKEEWVTGNPNANPSSVELSNFKSMYAQAVKIFA